MGLRESGEPEIRTPEARDLEVPDRRALEVVRQHRRRVRRQRYGRRPDGDRARLVGVVELERGVRARQIRGEVVEAHERGDRNLPPRRDPRIGGAVRRGLDARGQRDAGSGSPVAIAQTADLEIAQRHWMDDAMAAVEELLLGNVQDERAERHLDRARRGIELGAETGFAECEPFRDPAVVDLEDELVARVVGAGRRARRRSRKQVRVRADRGGEILALVVTLARGREPELRERKEPLVGVGSAESGAQLLERRTGIVLIQSRETQARENLMREHAGPFARDRVLSEHPVDLAERDAPDANRRRAAERQDHEREQSANRTRGAKARRAGRTPTPVRRARSRHVASASARERTVA